MAASDRVEKASPPAKDATISSVVFESPLYLDSAGSAHFHLEDGRNMLTRPGAVKLEPREKDMILARFVSAPQVRHYTAVAQIWTLPWLISKRTNLFTARSRRLISFFGIFCKACTVYHQ